MSKNARDNRPYIKPVTRIELSDGNFTLRWILIVFLLLIAATALVIGINSMMETQSGWAVIEVSSDQVNCSQDFQLYYDLGASKQGATAENKLLTAVYSKATEDAHMIFSAFDQKDGVNNVRYLNEHINEVVTVEPVLYEAFELLAAHGSHNIFMAPVYVEYGRIFSATSDASAADFDPARNEELIPYFAELAGFANDPDMISLELLGDNQVRLNVADEYLAYAEAEEIVTFIDFNWMTNAFIIDYMADTLAENGFTNGYLSSYDGFTRNLDTRGNSYSLNIFDNVDGTVYVPAVMGYEKPISIVALRSYPLVDEDRWHYYRYEDGGVVSVIADPVDGLNRFADNDLVGYSYEQGCAEILMNLIPVFIADEFRVDALNNLTADGIFSIWSDGLIISYNDADLKLDLDEESGYRISSVK